MGRKLVLTGTKLTDLAAPKLAGIDVILPEAGAVLLLDPASPVTPWPTFDLNSVNAINLPNLAYDQAKAMYPAGDVTTLGVAYAKGAGFENDNVRTRLERSAKGGLAAWVSQTVGQDSATKTVGVSLGAGLNTLLNTNKAHAFYVAAWGRILRGGSGAMTIGAQPHLQLNGSNNFTTFYTRYNSGGVTEYPTANPPKTNSSSENTLNTLGMVNQPFFQDIRISDASASPGTTGIVMRLNAGGTAADQVKSVSQLFYGVYIEDLTVSGRTYAQVNALVRAKYEKDVKTAGGRYYGDTTAAALA